jgi:hypothetical protein
VLGDPFGKSSPTTHRTLNEWGWCAITTRVGDVDLDLVEWVAAYDLPRTVYPLIDEVPVS